VFNFLFGWMIGSSIRTGRSSALPEAVKQQRYDDAVARKKARSGSVGIVLGIVVLALLLIGPVLGPVLLTKRVTTNAGVLDSDPKLDCGSALSPRNPPKVLSGSVTGGGLSPDDWCASKINGQKAWGIILTVFGLILWIAIAAALVKVRRERAALRGVGAVASGPPLT
jgi:hypothetical protein